MKTFRIEHDSPALSTAELFKGGLLRAVSFTVMWWLLTDGVMESWLVGIPAVSIATLASLALLPPSHLSPLGIARFVPFFLWQSIRGGVDVAWRAASRKMPIYPGIVDYPLRLPPGMPQVFMVQAVSLLPGTLAVDLSKGCLHTHVLDARGDFLSELKKVEQSVARAFGAHLQPSKEGAKDETV